MSDQVLHFLRTAEQLKNTVRSAHTSTGKQESVAEHSWRVALFALVLSPEYPTLNLSRVLSMCVVHDLAEAVNGDIPAPEQTRRAADGLATGKGDAERRDLLAITASLPADQRESIVGLWDEYEANTTPEARFVKAVDKLETILQHTQGKNPPNFDYAYNLSYGRRSTDLDQRIRELRREIDEETARLDASRKPPTR